MYGDNNYPLDRTSSTDETCDHWLYVPDVDVDTPHWGARLGHSGTSAVGVDEPALTTAAQAN